jgi:peptidyl-prolyl cis-trans isomerase SurA
MKRTRMMRFLTCFSTAFASCIMLTGPTVAQSNPFAPRLTVNERVISNYELEQRIQFLKLLRTPGDIEKLALDGLIEDRLRVQEAERLEIALTPEQILTGMEEFASRANLTREQFLTAIAEVGIEPETYRDFVSAGLVWRDVVRAKFGSKTDVTETEIDRALENQGRINGVRVLLSELIIPAPPGSEEEVLAQAQNLQSRINSEAGFAEAARAFSAAPSAARGGRMDWLPLANLPAAIGPFVLALAPGQVSDPVPIPGAVALFQLRGLEETNTEAPTTTQVEYAELLLPNDSNALARAAEISVDVDACNDLYAQGFSANQLTRKTQTMAEVPADVGLQLAQLDAGETSIDLVRGTTRVFLMLCNRMPVVEEPPTRDQVRTQIINQRLGKLADGYLADLRANAIITEP